MVIRTAIKINAIFLYCNKVKKYSMFFFQSLPHLPHLPIYYFCNIKLPITLIPKLLKLNSVFLFNYALDKAEFPLQALLAYDEIHF